MKQNEKVRGQALPKGFFPVRITVGKGLSERFIEEARQRHDVFVVQPPLPIGEEREEVVIAVPFADKEMLRVDFNIFASEMESEHGVRTEFLMESATEFMPISTSRLSQHR